MPPKSAERLTLLILVMEYFPESADCMQDAKSKFSATSKINAVSYDINVGKKPMPNRKGTKHMKTTNPSAKFLSQVHPVFMVLVAAFPAPGEMNKHVKNKCCGKGD